MAKTIFKYVLDGGDSLPVSMPAGARILHVHAQGSDVCVWALVDPFQADELRHFAVYGTGHAMPDDPGTYIGTVHMRAGTLVFHVFEARTKGGI